ncbi:maltooligosyltrehalose trehalohydrolase [Rhizobium sp. BK650]|uniref:malto-oligosyltrehalose trehalohydrolase n=1 Tax=Rhizobium sp. BK650 TaxID=2586990 RepID=UPI0017C8B3F6|nr:malto-oligosyltrehalose trehalohydrolase [Rhizobium sp. BK650]MBB3660843.1 maltooligosyltrehalose trehalohydrolase [Rhizobium sp. BK650]
MTMTGKGATASKTISGTRRYAVGAERVCGMISFRIWAPSHERVYLVLDDGAEHPMQTEEDGYFRFDLADAGPGLRYRYRLGDGRELYADPASRFQPEGPSGFSTVVDPFHYDWRDHDWGGVEADRQVLYEIHIGTFTTEGTYSAGAKKLRLLKDIGITCLEMMPVNEFCGAFGWGYDGVLPYAPSHLYGTPDDLRSFVDEAHTVGLGVILDVVYNHFGAGERYAAFTPDYFTDRYANEWGRSINYDGKNSQGVRTFIAGNAAYWIDEFHFDGLRIDATQALFDSSDEHILAVIAREARAAAKGKSVYLVGENEPQDTRLVKPADHGGFGLDSVWNDDFHHSAAVALTGRNDAYYHDHHGMAQEFVSAAKYGYLFQGQRYDWQNASRGRPGLDLKTTNFVHFLQNHDQIANSGTGERIERLASPSRMRAMTALLLLGPQTPMLFQGQEFGASSPFFYFADQTGEFEAIVRNGRLDFLRQFPNLEDDVFSFVMPKPGDRSTFERSKLDWSAFDANSHIVSLHRDLLRLRRESKAFAQEANDLSASIDGSVLGRSAFLLRYFATKAADERLLIVNFGHNLEVSSLADPLFAPPAGCQWNVEWSSEDLVYGGRGKRPINVQRRWVLDADCALVFAPRRTGRQEAPDGKSLRQWQKAISNV